MRWGGKWSERTGRKNGLKWKVTKNDTWMPKELAFLENRGYMAAHDQGGMYRGFKTEEDAMLYAERMKTDQNGLVPDEELERKRQETLRDWALEKLEKEKEELLNKLEENNTDIQNLKNRP